MSILITLLSSTAREEQAQWTGRVNYPHLFPHGDKAQQWGMHCPSLLCACGGYRGLASAAGLKMELGFLTQADLSSNGQFTGTCLSFPLGERKIIAFMCLGSRGGSVEGMSLVSVCEARRYVSIRAETLLEPCLAAVISLVATWWQ